jgi:hypothetical protein
MIYCKGITKLCQIVFSGLAGGDKIVYLEYINTYDISKELFNIELERKIALHIQKCFDIDLVIIGPLEYKLAPILSRFTSKSKYPSLKGVVEIKDGDLISSNLIRPLGRMLRGKKLNVYSEGASGLSRIFNNKNKVLDLYYLLRQIKKQFNMKIGGFDSERGILNWVMFDTPDRIVSSLIGSDATTTIIDFKIVNKNRKKFKKYLLENFNDFKRVGNEVNFFHSTISELSDSEYKIYANSIKKIVNQDLLLIKTHPNDVRNYNNIFSALNVIIIQEDFRSFPAEIILANNNNVTYVGYYSTIMLSFKIDKIILVEPQDIKIRDLYKREYWAMIKAFDKFLKNTGE